jgi:D-alanyl-D-alanine dipeptidase
MPNAFVYLRDVDPTIMQDMRYASANNFTGKKVPGYDAPECVLVQQAAEALKAVQADVKAQGYSLKVYDCYRPARAVAAFATWAQLPEDPSAKSTYYPSLDKRALFPGYIATRSSHSRGAAMDVTLVPLEAGAVASSASTAPCTAPKPERQPDASIDMGTGFDCFDVKANTAFPGLTLQERANRSLLLEAMQRRGFQNYGKEWWHYMLKNEPFPDTNFDFPIEPHR